jgi:hypothetical protein
MAIQSNFPAIKPSLLLDFANVKQLDPRITYTRASTASYYDGVTTAMAEQNLFLQSQTFDNASWLKSRITVTPDVIVAPDGTTTADAIYETAVTNTHYANQAFAPNGQAFTVSVFAKGGLGRDWIWFRTINSSSVERTAYFDITNGIVGTVGAGLTATIQSVGTWYRCIVTTANSNTAVDGWGFGPASADNTNSYAGDITKGVYFWGGQLEQRSSVSAPTVTTTQAITNYIPALQTAASGVARFDHNPTTDESLGLLIEESRTNLILRSEEFDNASWTKSSLTIAANTVVSPDGTLNADKFIGDSGQAMGAPAIYQSYSKAASAITYTYSIYAKSAGYNRIQILVRDSSTSANNAFVVISVVDGSVVTAASVSGTFTNASSSVASVGNGWYRISLTFTTGTETTIRTYVQHLDSVITTTNGFSGVFIWGAQLEAGAFATSYIPTVASQVTRAADAASMTGTNFSSWYSQGEGTFYVDSVTATLTQLQYLIAAYQGASFNDAIGMNTSSSGSSLYVGVGGTSQVSLSSSITAGSPFKSSSFYKVNDFAFSVNAGTAQTDAIGTVPFVDNFSIGSRNGGVAKYNGTIKKIAYYPMRVTNAQLQALTS